MNLCRITLFLCAMLLFLMMQSVAQAAPFTPQEREDLNQRQRQEAQEREAQQKRPDVFLPSGKEQDLGLFQEDPQGILIHHIKLEGDRQSSFPWLLPRLHIYQGKRIGLAGLDVILKDLTNALIDKGYITTRVTLREQDISNGKLTFTIIPGVIRDIRFADAGTGAWQPAFSCRPGDLLNIRDIEQGLEQLKRLPSQEIDFQIVPGEKPGESDILIKRKQDKLWRMSTSIDDAGSTTTGRVQGTATLSLDNMLGMQDMFYLSGFHDLGGHQTNKGSDGHSLYYSVPAGKWTFTYMANQHQYHQSVAGVTGPFSLSGKSDSQELRVQRLLHRDQKSKTHLQARIIQKEARSYINDVEIEVQRKDTTAAELALSQRRYFGKNVLDWQVAYRRGVP